MLGATAIGGLFSLEALLYGYTEIVPDNYRHYTPVSCKPIDSDNTFFLQRLLLQEKEQRAILTAVSPKQESDTDLPGHAVELRQRTLVVYREDMAAQGISCDAQTDTIQPPTPSKLTCDFTQTQGQYIGGIFSPRVPQGQVACTIPDPATYQRIQELYSDGKVDAGLVLRMMDPTPTGP